MNHSAESKEFNPPGHVKWRSSLKNLFRYVVIAGAVFSLSACSSAKSTAPSAAATTVPQVTQTTRSTSSPQKPTLSQHQQFLIDICSQSPDLCEGSNALTPQSSGGISFDNLGDRICGLFEAGESATTVNDNVLAAASGTAVSDSDVQVLIKEAEADLCSQYQSQ